MEKSNKLREEFNKRINQNQGYTTSAYICGIIALGAAIGFIVPEVISVPALKEIQQGLKWAASASTLAVAPILTIKGINSKDIKLLRRVGGIDKNGKTINSLEGSNRDCAILEINKIEQQKKGIHQAIFITALVSGIAALGITLSDKELPRILEFVSRLKDEFQAAVVTGVSTIFLELVRLLRLNTEIDLIEKTTGVDYNSVWNKNVENGERGPKVKTIRQIIKAGASKTSKIFNKKKGE